MVNGEGFSIGGEGIRGGGGGAFNAGLMFSCCWIGLRASAARGGTNAVWTGVNPPIPDVPTPPQNPRAPSLGEVGKSFCVLGVRSGLCAREAAEGAGEGAWRGAGGGRTGASAVPLPARRFFLRAAISWRRATFSDFEEPSSERMAEMRASRSDMSASRVEMYSIRGRVLV